MGNPEWANDLSRLINHDSRPEWMAVCGSCETAFDLRENFAKITISHTKPDQPSSLTEYLVGKCPTCGTKTDSYFILTDGELTAIAVERTDFEAR